MADMTEIQKNLANTMAKDEGARMADFMGNPAAYLTGLGISFQSLPPQAQEAFQSLAAGDISGMEVVWPEINNIVSEKAKQMQEGKSTPSYSVNQEAANNASTISLGAQMPQDKSQITIPAPTLDAGNVISEKQGTSPYTVNQDALANAPTVSVKAQTPQANDQISVPAPNLDAGKVLSVTPEMPKDETQITIPAPNLDAGKVISSAPEKQNQSEQPSVEAVPEVQAGKKPLNFKDGFELSEAAKKKLRENDKGLWGIAEDFASAQEPEDAFMAAFVGLLLYLPNKAMAKLDEMEVRREEMKAHIEKQAHAHDHFVAHGLGMGAED